VAATPANNMGRVRARIALGLAFLATAIGLLIDMSGSAPRLAGDDHVRWPPPALVATVPGGGALCTSALVLPADAARMVMTIGKAPHVGGVLPRVGIQYTTAAGVRTVNTALRAGATAGETVSLPLGYPHGPDADGTLCLHVGGHQELEFGGDAPLGGTTIDGAAVPVRVSILFYRPGRESWWSLLGTLDLRLGLGKSPIFGDWTLPVIFIAFLAMWFGAARLLWRELR
jgi:hypothetical protein